MLHKIYDTATDPLNNIKGYNQAQTLESYVKSDLINHRA